MSTNGADMYLNLLAKSLTGTLFDTEPDHDSADPRRFVVAFALHYIRGQAVTMLPRVRLENIRACIETVMRDGVIGDTAETGVWRGGGCIFMRGCLDVFGGADRTVWVADSFEGLPDPGPEHERESRFHHSDMMQKSYNKMAASLEEVQANFAAYDLMSDQVRFLKGWFNETLATAPIQRLALLRLDGDYYSSTVDALSALYDKVSPGGFVIVDDYGEDLWTECRKAVDEFREQRGIRAPMVAVDSKCVYWRK